MNLFFGVYHVRCSDMPITCNAEDGDSIKNAMGPQKIRSDEQQFSTASLTTNISEGRDPKTLALLGYNMPNCSMIE